MMTIDHEIFDSMREDLNEALNNLFHVMSETKRNTGSLSLRLNVLLSPREGTYPDTGEFKVIQVPQFEHKIKISVKNDASLNGVSTGDYELSFSADGAELTEVFDGQTSLFRKDPGEVQDDE